MIKPFLHQATIDKIRIFGSDKDEWKAALLEEVEADQLPAFLGGTLTDADGNPMCPSLVKKNKLRYNDFNYTSRKTLFIIIIFNSMSDLLPCSLTWVVR